VNAFKPHLAGLADYPYAKVEARIKLDQNAPPLRLKLSPNSLNEFRIAQLKKVLREHPGDSRVLLHLGENKVLRLADEFCVDLERVVGELRVVFGHDAVML